MKTSLFLTTLLWTSIMATATAATADTSLPGPRLDGLGRWQHPVTTSNPEAQRFFDQGLTLLYAFNHKEAARSFRSAAALDPACAMAHWGIAMAHGPHVNRPMTREDNDAAWAALQRARAHRAAVTPREQAYLDALTHRFQETHLDDRAALDQAFAAAMRDLVREYPDDLDAQVLLAEAVMDTMPWDYWTQDRSPKPETEEALAALRFVMSRAPDHPGANHFYIHAVEAGPDPLLGLPAADRLAHYAPAAGHLVHMPSHIYMRVGQYREATLANERAVKADRDYIRACKAQGFYPGVYYPHNIHFLWFAQLFEGRSADAQRTAGEAAQYALDNVCGPNPVLEAPRLRHLPLLTALRFGRWDDILKTPEPAGTNDVLVDRAVWHFARGLVHAQRKASEPAAREWDALAGLLEGESLKRLDSPIFPVSATLRVAERWLAARVAGVQGNTALMRQRFEEAVAAEDALPYMEPAYWPLPVRPAFGAALLEAGDAPHAETVFREDLRRLPRNAWGLLGLRECLRQQGKQQSADLVHRQFEEAWKHADTPLQFAWF